MTCPPACAIVLPPRRALFPRLDPRLRRPLPRLPLSRPMDCPRLISSSRRSLAISSSLGSRGGRPCAACAAWAAIGAPRPSPPPPPPPPPRFSCGTAAALPDSPPPLPLFANKLVFAKSSFALRCAKFLSVVARTCGGGRFMSCAGVVGGDRSNGYPSRPRYRLFSFSGGT